MAEAWSVVLARSARKELEQLPESQASKILTRIEDLASNPRPRGIRKLKGSDNLWRLRIGDYRVVYAVRVDDRLVDIIAVRHRRDAYR